MSDPGTALGLRMPRRAVARTAVRVPLYALVLLVFLLPLWTLVSTAFSGGVVKTGQVTLFPQHPTLSNLTTAWHFGVGRGLLNSLIVVAVGLTLQVTVSALAAYALARKKFRGIGLVMALILATMMMPEEIIAIPTYLVLGHIPQPFTGGSLLDSYGGLILPLVGWALPIFVLTGFMKTIPVELEEAARIDGAGEFTIFFRIILPLCRPALGTCAVFGFLMIWDQYLLPLLVAQSPRLYTLTLVVTSLQSSQELGQGVRLAAALVLMVPSVLVYLVLQRFFERGLLTGSVKG
ncbi:carbohydrate ABC transporter permease [Streptomyces sp. NPDC056112]|uniref:carbohydrate ABC transporter permease n=1 Tax=unclassified Streptomyces TaxID=2593676 RepID=UPI001CD27708|nr:MULTISPECIES: carbohydrate ABC transporter permease [unclassified Streptomyces]